MENASKALIIAGGMLLAILLISLFIYAWSLISKYQSSQDSLKEIEDTAKFNEQFTAYDRNDVQGYELVSLINKTLDYNYRLSNEPGAKNDVQYKPITININLNNNAQKDFSKAGKLYWFINNEYNQKEFNDKILKNVKATEKTYGGMEKTTKEAKNQPFNSTNTKLLGYFEYIQFKKGVFQSKSNEIKYDNDTGRISEMSFVYININ